MTCRVVGWNTESKKHVLLMRDGNIVSQNLGDFYHFYRTDCDLELDV